MRYSRGDGGDGGGSGVSGGGESNGINGKILTTLLWIETYREPELNLVEQTAGKS